MPPIEGGGGGDGKETAFRSTMVLEGEAPHAATSKAGGSGLDNVAPALADPEGNYLDLGGGVDDACVTPGAAVGWGGVQGQGPHGVAHPEEPSMLDMIENEVGPEKTLVILRKMVSL